MNHVILLLRPLKMKDWLLRGIKTIAVKKMNSAFSYQLQKKKTEGVFRLSSDQWATFAVSDKK